MGIIINIIIMIRASDTAIFACIRATACRRRIWQAFRCSAGTLLRLWLAHQYGVCGIFGQTMRTGHEEEDIWRDTLGC
jgi:hypothetical protein